MRNWDTCRGGFRELSTWSDRFYNRVASELEEGAACQCFPVGRTRCDAQLSSVKFPFCDPDLAAGTFATTLGLWPRPAAAASLLLLASLSVWAFSCITLRSALPFLPLAKLLLQVVACLEALWAAKDRGCSHPQCLGQCSCLLVALRETAELERGRIRRRNRFTFSSKPRNFKIAVQCTVSF